MELPDTLKSKSVQELEEWFLGALSSADMPVGDMVAVVASLKSSESSQQAGDCVSMLREELIRRGDGPGVLSLLEGVCQWCGKNDAFRKSSEDALKAVFKDRLGAAMVDSIGLASGIDLREALRRLRCLLGLKTGTLCLDKTWGFGIVRQVDEFYRRITIDFSRKQNHQMSFAYAGEALRILDEAHVLVIKHRKPAEVAAMVREEPGRLVKLVLTSYGPVTVNMLKDLVVPEFVEESGWKTFWDSARRALKADKTVDIPSTRNEPVRILSGGVSTDVELLRLLAVERDLRSILAAIDEISGVKSIDVSRDDVRAIIIDRLAFVAKAARGRGHDLLAKVVVHARLILKDGFDSASLVDGLSNPGAIVACVEGLSAREIKQFLGCLLPEERDRLVQFIPGIIPRLPFKALGEVIDYLAAHGQEGASVGVIKDLVLQKKAGVDVLFWLAKHTDRMSSFGICTHYDLFRLIVDTLGNEFAGERLRIRNQLLELIGEKEWLDGVLQAMDSRQRAEILHRLNSTANWDQSSRRSIMARMIKAYPELGGVLTGAGEDDAAGQPTRFTSWRSYRERQAQYKKLVDTDIPQNSRDIGVARSYGDLRENYEYKAAREMQGVLMRRKAEWEADLKQVRGTDFADMPRDVVGMGTSVLLEKQDGTTETFNILGEWDRDEALNIIGIQSKVAATLAGHKVGDFVMIPRGLTEDRCRIAGISGLPETVRAWMGSQG